MAVLPFLQSFTGSLAVPWQSGRPRQTKFHWQSGRPPAVWPSSGSLAVLRQSFTGSLAVPGSLAVLGKVCKVSPKFEMAVWPFRQTHWQSGRPPAVWPSFAKVSPAV